MTHISKLALDDIELSAVGQYSVRVDQTIVVELRRSLTLDMYNRLAQHSHFNRVRFFSGTDTYTEFKGPYKMKKVNGILILQSAAG